MKFTLSSIAALLIFGANISCTSAGNNKDKSSNTSETMTNTPATDTNKHIETAIFAGGCFWGVQYFFEKAKGVVDTKVGYIGGHVDNPTYEDVCSHTSGHYEAIQVKYDNRVTNYEAMARLFFNIHDPTQTNGQGPDIGEQYMSVVFYADDSQKQIAQNLIAELKKKGYKIATQLKLATHFWPAEEYHEHHYDREGTTPYCHHFQDKFN
jgi:peptide methionine sulfoxide reductase msrA/msrB